MDEYMLVLVGIGDCLVCCCCGWGEIGAALILVRLCNRGVLFLGFS